jgi:hypothetical protein
MVLLDFEAEDDAAGGAPPGGASGALALATQTRVINE